MPRKPHAESVATAGRRKAWTRLLPRDQPPGASLPLAARTDGQEGAIHLSKPKLTPADPVAAFEAVNAMEEPLGTIRGIAAILVYMAQAEGDGMLSSALSCIAMQLYEQQEKADALQGDAFHLLHGCTFPELHREDAA